jgi:hypothetical protein
MQYLQEYILSALQMTRLVMPRLPSRASSFLCNVRLCLACFQGYLHMYWIVSTSLGRGTRCWVPYECEALCLSHFLDSQVTDGEEIVSRTCQPPFTFRNSLRVLISVRGWVDLRGVVRLEGFAQSQNSMNSGNRTHVIPVCRRVPQVTTISPSTVHMCAHMCLSVCIQQSHKFLRFVPYWKARALSFH